MFLFPLSFPLTISLSLVVFSNSFSYVYFNYSILLFNNFHPSYQFPLFLPQSWISTNLFLFPNVTLSPLLLLFFLFYISFSPIVCRTYSPVVVSLLTFSILSHLPLFLIDRSRPVSFHKSLSFILNPVSRTFIFYFFHLCFLFFLFSHPFSFLYLLFLILSLIFFLLSPCFPGLVFSFPSLYSNFTVFYPHFLPFLLLYLCDFLEFSPHFFLSPFF